MLAPIIANTNAIAAVAPKATFKFNDMFVSLLAYSMVTQLTKRPKSRQ